MSVNPGPSAWATRNFVLSIDAYSANPYCRNHGSGISFRVRKPTTPAVQQPATTVMPAMVCHRLDQALNALWALGLKRAVILGPTAGDDVLAHLVGELFGTLLVEVDHGRDVTGHVGDEEIADGHVVLGPGDQG